MIGLVAAHLDPPSRVPIWEGDDRNGVLDSLHCKELVYRACTNPADATLRGIMRPGPGKGPDEPAAELLQVFVNRHKHVAVVRGPDGTTLDLAALEDVVEALVGALADEFDCWPRTQYPLRGGNCMVKGGLPVQEMRTPYFFVSRNGGASARVNSTTSSPVAVLMS